MLASLVSDAAAAALLALEASEAIGDGPAIEIVSSAGLPLVIDLASIFDQLRELADHLDEDG